MIKLSENMYLEYFLGLKGVACLSVATPMIITYTPKKKYPNDRDFWSRFLTLLVNLSTEGLILQKNFINIDWSPMLWLPGAKKAKG